MRVVVKRNCFLAALCGLFLVSCTSSGVLQVNPGEYMVSTTGSSPAFTGTEDAIKRAYKDAGEFCTKKGLVVETVSLEKVEQRLGRAGRATLTFRCVKSEAH